MLETKLSIKIISKTYILVDCQLSEWKELIGCNKTCGNATRTMNREVLVEASNGGKDCGPLINITNCNLDPCSGSDEI